MKAICVFSLAFFSAVNSTPQEVAFLDLTNPPSPRTHQPKFGSGTGGMVIAADAAAIHQEHPLRITLLPLARDAFQPGEDVIYEIKIQNTDKQARILPWDPNIADVEPAGPSQQYDYKQAIVSLWFTSENKLTEASQVSVLYGTKERTGSTLPLEPGQSARIRAKARLSFHDERFFACAPARKVSAKASVSFASATVTVGNGGYYEQIKADGPTNLSVNTARFDLVNPGR